MLDLSRLALLSALLFSASCSSGAPSDAEGSSVVVAQRGAGFTEELRAEDAAQGVATVPVEDTSGGDEDGPSASGSTAAQPSAETLVVGSVDANAAANLKADPSAHASTQIENLVTFRMLSLAGVNLDALLDYLFTPTSERAQSFTFPDEIKALGDKEAAVVGYMIPLEYKPKTDDIKVFMLVRDLMSCCFGGAPRPDEWIYVEMDGDRACKLYPYLPITVRGTLKVGRIEDEFGLSSGVYSMKAISVEEFKAE
ncbi:MAG: DUF3299 domain-containing protein [Planctomycetota bacterium]